MFFPTVLLLTCSFFSSPVFGLDRLSSLVHHRHARLERFANSQLSHHILEERHHNYRFLNNKTSRLVPIDSNDPSRALFFVFAPKLGDSVDEVTIWLSGGPGSSSLEGFIQINGPFLWYPGTLAPVANPYSWTNLTNMLWVEQPVGTGFALGKPTATTQEETAQDFIKFFKNFQDLFGIKKFKIYMTGGSYAGRYIPYISAAMLDANDTDYYDLRGALLYDPTIGSIIAIQEEYVAVPYVQEYNNVLRLNASTMAKLERLHYQTCGYADYLDKYLTFPASEVQPPAYFNFTTEADCDVYDMIYSAVFTINPCFDIYHITQLCPLLSDILGHPTLVAQDQYPEPFFNRTDVKQAMHAPEYVHWKILTQPVYVGDSGGPEGVGDLSADPIQHVLPRLIEATNRVLISNADLDMIIITNGTLLSIQNMTWNGALGFQQMPGTPIVIDLPDPTFSPGVFVKGNASAPPQGVMGVQHYERGLMWAQSFQSGHMQAEFQPRTAYVHLEWVLGRREKL